MYKVIVLIVLLIVIAVLSLFLYKKNKFRLDTINPNNPINSNSFVVIEFNKTITNKDEVLKNITTNPSIDVSIIINDKRIVINSQGFVGNLTVVIPVIVHDSEKIENLKINLVFNTSSKNEISYDLGDLDLIQFPKITELQKLKSKHYSLSYEIDDNNIPIIIISLEDTSDDIEREYDNPINKQFDFIISSNKVALDDINKVMGDEPYLISYSDEYQESIVGSIAEDHNKDVLSKISDEELGD